MKTVTFVLFLSFYWALHTQAQTGNIDRHRVRAEQLSYEKFAESVESTRSLLVELHEVTRLLAEHCNLEKVRNHRYISYERPTTGHNSSFRSPFRETCRVSLSELDYAKHRFPKSHAAYSWLRIGKSSGDIEAEG